MKRIINAVLVLLLMLSLCACSDTDRENNTSSENNQNAEEAVTPEPEKNNASGSQITSDSTTDTQQTSQKDETSVLVVCFSATGNTMAIADMIAEILAADRFEIVPLEAYSKADLDYNSDCRANREQNDDSARPGFVGTIDSVEQYDVIFLGYPIWWGKLPKIMYTFLEQYNFSGKTIIPFCTSGSSGNKTSVKEIRSLLPDAKVNDGRRFASKTKKETIQKWLDELDLPKKEAGKEMIQIRCGEKTLSFVPLENASVTAFIEKLKEGDISIAMNDYGDFEKVGNLGFSLPQSDEQITTKPGDVILYQGTSVTIYYDENSWNFTRLGTIPGMTRKTMLDFFDGSGEVTVTFSLN